VLVDGGKGQLGAAIAALEELGLGEQAVASLAKREELIFVRGREQPIALPRSSPVLQLVQRARDEAHRFAVGYHRQLRSRRTIASELDGIAGVGPAKRRKLLSAFGSLRGVRGATEGELASVVGRVMAARLRAFFDRGPGGA
jgi:excinuclease ABC subunit C